MNENQSRSILDKLVQCNTRLISIGNQLKSTGKQLEEMKELAKIQNGRVKALEMFQSKLTGIVIGGVFAVSVIWSVMKFLK